MPWKSILLVGLGGGLGSIMRFLCQKYVAQVLPLSFPWGTFLVNVAGCFIIGLLYGYSARHISFAPEIKLLLMTGFCGGFTTFSAFTLEGLGLLQEQRFITFLLYFAASVTIGLAATFIGYRIGY